MEYRVIAEKVESVMSRNVEGAVEDLARRVNELIAGGWEPLGGVAMAGAGTAPYLLQALIKR